MIHLSHKIINNYFDNDILQSEKEYIEEHIQSCSRCAEEFKQYSILHGMLLKLPQLKTEENLVPKVMEKLSKVKVKKEKSDIVIVSLIGSFAVFILLAAFTALYVSIQTPAPATKTIGDSSFMRNIGILGKFFEGFSLSSDLVLTILVLSVLVSGWFIFESFKGIKRISRV